MRGRYAAGRPHPYVSFNLAGDEEHFPAGDFAELFEVAAASGLGCSVHAGRDGPESARPSPCRSRASGTVCARSRTRRSWKSWRPGRSCSNAVPPASSRPRPLPVLRGAPLPALAAAGVPVTLGSDDPPWFGASIGGEYRVCAERLGWATLR